MTIARKKYKCHLSMNAFRILCEKETLEFNSMQKWMNENPLDAVPKVIYYGMLNHVYFAGDDAGNLPTLDFVSAHILDDMDSLEKYSKQIAIAFGGEDAKDDEGKK